MKSNCIYVCTFPLYLYVSGWPVGLNVQDMLEKRMSAAIADPGMDMDLGINGGDRNIRIQACLWCMRNPQIGCNGMSYCSGFSGLRLRRRL